MGLNLPDTDFSVEENKEDKECGREKRRRNCPRANFSGRQPSPQKGSGELLHRATSLDGNKVWYF